jgi:transcriptional regulator with XRE-family HTH domain
MMVVGRGESRGKRRAIDLDVAIGRRVRLQRTLRNVTQAELASAIGITFQQIQKYELGTHRISAGKLLQIARFLTAPVSAFFDGLEERINETVIRLSNGHENFRLFVGSGEGERLIRACAQIQDKAALSNLVHIAESLAQVDIAKKPGT